MMRWLGFLLAIAVGMGAALYYGWVINPLHTVTTTPAVLRDDFKTDYVWMVAEAYQLERSLDLALERLQWLDGAGPKAAVQDALLDAMQSNFRDSDIKYLRELDKALQGDEVPSEELPTPALDMTPTVEG